MGNHFFAASMSKSLNLITPSALKRSTAAVQKVDCMASMRQVMLKSLPDTTNYTHTREMRRDKKVRRRMSAIEKGTDFVNDCHHDRGEAVRQHRKSCSLNIMQHWRQPSCRVIKCNLKAVVSRNLGKGEAVNTNQGGQPVQQALP